ncbi:DoxX family protein [Stackebrandtia nassauensis]|uniref:DoxX family protein n=1 Tax=Stackebrandtia nassauensis (strain DSM 44728 / CIP 108903 / NRRL B-16338 / NBRC 102104 / LLR-40K-21) TaxID=446470 RepID=D3PZS4_STANL|nr:DoxX family protein [Stackebrandtia nassauensis]ADD43611.1 DoxX family protein [Stackebrandtia nassauensis DSM 44728]
MKILLWILQVALALFFANAGFAKVSQPIGTLADTMTWIEYFPSGTVPILGALEMLAAIGLILPAAFGIVEILTPLAATGLVLMMIGAAITHATLSEWPAVGLTVVIAAIAAFTAWGRFRLLRQRKPETVPAAANLSDRS